ncbi:MAG: hypothetical protein LQ341_005943, partial [Variospora aurantia]
YRSTTTGLDTCHNSTEGAIEHHKDEDQHRDIGSNNKTPCNDSWPASEGQKNNDSQPPPPFTGIIVEEQPNQDRVYPSLFKRSIIITALCLGTLLDAIDITIIGVAVPTISTEFNALDDVGWYGSAYLLSLTALQPVFGVVYKFFDPKTVYLCSVLVFEAGSIISAAAPSSPVFILGRAVTGCTVHCGAFGSNRKETALSQYRRELVWCCCLLRSDHGVALTDRASWRWCFWVNVPVGVVVAIVILFFLHLEGISNVERRLPLLRKLRHLDPVRVCLLIASVCCLVLALQWGGFTEPRRSPKIIGILIGSELMGIAFFVYEWKIGDNAMLPLRVFGQRSVLMGCLYGCFLQMINDTDTYYIPFYFQATQGASAISSGAKFISLVLPEIIAIVVTGAIVSKIGHYVPFMIGGACIAALGTGLLTRITLGTPTV